MGWDKLWPYGSVPLAGHTAASIRAAVLQLHIHNVKRINVAASAGQLHGKHGEEGGENRNDVSKGAECKIP